jgi:hypothetical protein
MPVEPPLDTQELVQRVVHHQLRLPEYSQPVYIEDAQSIDDLVVEPILEESDVVIQEEQVEE